MGLAPGQRLGPYEIVGTLGSGGMGTVYRARDTRLQRDVAIKVSASHFGERFEREARVIAQLNHPNICTLFDVGPDYLVMEFVDGETLAERLHRGPIPQDQVIRIGQQITEALDIAHDRGVIHRDLKPGNVMLRPDGRVKVLDFGLAKIVEGSAAHEENTDSPTITMEATAPGVILGTASYMSPEQAMGNPSDKRSDVYAFGAVVYEMLTGERLHRGTATTEVLASVIKDEPQWDKVPARFRKLLRSALAKDPQQRLRHIGDAMRLVEESESPAVPSPKARSRKIGRLWAVAAAVLIAAGGAFAWWWTQSSPQKLEVVRFQILENGQFKLENSQPSVSPDGKWVAFQAPGADGVSRIWLRALDSIETRMIPGTETPNVLQAPPFWSHDSKTILFASNSGTFSPGQMKRVDITGGAPQTVAETQAGIAGAAWSPDGTIVFLDSSKRYLQRVPATGGTPLPVTALREADLFHTMPQFLPDGRTFLYHRMTRGRLEDGTYAGSLDKPPEEQSTKPILRSDRQSYYSPAGGDHMLFLRDQTLFAQPFNVSSLTLEGQPVAVVDGVSSFVPAGAGRYSVSNNGVLSYNAGPVSIGKVAIVDRATGAVQKTLGPLGEAQTAGSLSPDGKRWAFRRLDPATGTTSIWVTNLETDNTTKITYGNGRSDNPIWSPDGNSLVFASNHEGLMNIYIKNADGSGEDRLILRTDKDKTPTSWSRSGFLAYTSGGDLWVLPNPENGSSQPIPFLRSKALEEAAIFSPDGKWVAYTSDESGQRELYVRSFDPSHIEQSPTGNQWLISRGGASGGVWTKGGRELLYISRGNVVAQAVDLAKPYELKGPPQTVAEITAGVYGITPDGSKLFRAIVPPGDVPGQLVIVKNWHAILQK